MQVVRFQSNMVLFDFFRNVYFTSNCHTTRVIISIIHYQLIIKTMH